jgi:deoxyhypusine synthase
MSTTQKLEDDIRNLVNCLKTLEASNNFTCHEDLMKLAQTKIKELHVLSNSNVFIPSDEARNFAKQLADICNSYREKKRERSVIYELAQELIKNNGSFSTNY